MGELYVWERKYEEAIRSFQKSIEKGGSQEVTLLYARAILYAGNPEKAKQLLLDMNEEQPENREVKAYLADCYAYEQQFGKAIALYKELLADKDDLLIKKKLAETLSWNTEYKESIALYDEMMKEQYEVALQRQKARVLGWAQQYDKAEEEYTSILQKQYDPSIALEMEAKAAYWDGRWIMAEKRYQELISLEPDNVEALFDVSQMHSYRLEWQKSIDAYHRILLYEPNHFRAKEGLYKVELITGHPSLDTSYRGFSAFSPDRLTDIDKHQFMNFLTMPLTKEASLHLDTTLTRRTFDDYPHILEREGSLSIARQMNPDSSVNLYSGVIVYDSHTKNKMQPISPDTLLDLQQKQQAQRAAAEESTPGIEPEPLPPLPTKEPVPPLHHKHFWYYGGSFSHRQSDRVTLSFRANKERLENNSTVIRKSMYYHAFQGRVDINCSRNLKMGADYLYAHYSDHNRFDQPGIDLVYFLSRDPKRLYLEGRYYLMNFKKRSQDYWTPKNYSAGSAAVGLRYYLNKGEVFYGMDALYYDLKYELTVDSTDVVEHRLRWGFSWDISKQLNIHIGGNVLRAVSGIYKENEFIIGLKYYF